MELEPVTQAEIIAWLKSQPPFPGSYLQTPWWLELNEISRGQKVELLGLKQAGRLVGVCSAILVTPRPGFVYAYVPRGPVVAEPGLVDEALSALRQVYKKRAFFVRAEPVVPQVGELKPEEQLRFLSGLRRKLSGFRRMPEIQPRATLVLDLRLSASELLNQMNSKTRYNIRLAERKELTFRWGALDDFPRFWELLQLTAERGGFSTHAFTHYHTLLSEYGSSQLGEKDFGVHLGLVEYQGKLLAASMLLSCLGTVTYIHGASSREHRDLMAPYLLHWRAVQAAQAAGFAYYDFWGISPFGTKRSHWEGFTRFKLGWGGRRIEYLGTLDFAYQPLAYYLYHLGRLFYLCLRFLRRLMRRSNGSGE